MISGQGGRGCGGCGGHAGRGPGGSRGNAYTGGRVKTTKVGFCKDLEGNVFDFGTSSTADQMQITQEKIASILVPSMGKI
jgi:hypothetical protein